MVVECDTHIHEKCPYKGIRPVAIHGRGGTSFEAPIIYGNNTFRPDALIYFTDGCAPAPITLARYPLLWVITTDGITNKDPIRSDLPGKKLRMT